MIVLLLMGSCLTVHSFIIALKRRSCHALSIIRLVQSENEDKYGKSQIFEHLFLFFAIHNKKVDLVNTFLEAWSVRRTFLRRDLTLGLVNTQHISISHKMVEIF